MKIKTREEYIQERLCQLYDDYFNSKNAIIDAENELTEQRNNDRIKNWKSMIRRTDNTEKPALDKKKRPYTQEQFMDEFNYQYGQNLYRSKFSKYLNGTTCPTEKTLYDFADFFHVTIDYLVGRDDVKNPTTSKVRDVINLTEQATNTLITCGKNPIATAVLNALLSDERTAEYMFMNLYEQAYRTYERKQSPESHGDYDTELTMRNLSNAITFNRYLEDTLIKYLKPEYAERFQEDMAFKQWRSNHYDEYEAEINSAIAEAYPAPQITITNVTLAPVKSDEDSQ